MLSVIIAACNEPYLDRTIDSCFNKAQGEVEVVVVLDGYWPKVPIKDRKGLTLVHHKNIGQRPSVNEAARLATGKYLMKLDAHCILDEGYDIKLAEDCEYDWTVIPRRYGIIEDGWKRRPGKVDYMRMTSPSEKGDLGLRATAWTDFRNRPEAQGDITDVMICQGSCWFLHRDRFWELGGLDEGHGHWGAMGAEVSCKAWLSGGRLVVNKKTWYAHWQRGRRHTDEGSTSRYYHLPRQVVRDAHRYAKSMWFNNKWPLQKRDFEWLINKFSPVPGWQNGCPEFYKEAV
jgi:glycosyltransferase involved in cell wall biosynthesis